MGKITGEEFRDALVSMGFDYGDGTPLKEIDPVLILDFLARFGIEDVDMLARFMLRHGVTDQVTD